MAVSDTDIVNLALSHLGDKAGVSSIAPTDGTMQSQYAALFYAQGRDYLLERFPWKFATRRESPALRSDLSFSAWPYVYNEPNNVLRVLAALPEGYTSDQQGVEFDTESDSSGQALIMSKVPLDVVRSIYRITDPGRFSPGFVEAFSWFLASVLAGPIVKGETGRAESVRCLQAAQVAFAGATGLSASQSKLTLSFTPSFIQARGQTGDITGDAEISR
ncbi:hypothetical protein SR18_gp045c [Caulobacter phage SR18]|nr:hypothetical protein SR18_gp045c [Caulobacter phage SR18]WCD56228.1 hypothetical protein [Caulobacter phage BL94]